MATTSDEVFNLLKHELYECIVISEEFMGDDTFKLVTEIKKKYDYPIILTTRKTHSELSDITYTSGVDEVLNSIQKPGKLAVLASSIKKNVEKWRSDYLYHQLLDKNIDAIVIIDEEKIVFANNQASNIMGLDDPTKLVGYNVLDILIGEDLNEIRQLLEDVSSGKLSDYKFDSQIRTFDTEIKDIEIYSTGINYKGKRACIAYCRDITDRKITERSLSENKQLLETFMDSAPESFYLYDSELRLIKINKRIYSRTKITEADYGKHIFELSPLLKQTDRLTIYRRVLKTGNPEIIEANMENETVGKRYYSIRVFKVLNGLGLIMTDITDQRNIQNALEQSEERYRTLVESSPNAISVLVDNKIVYVNKKRVELTGHKDKSELIGVDPIQQIAKDEVVKILDRLDDRNTGKPLSPVTEFKMKRKDGEFINVLDFTSNIIWEGKRGVLHILQDVTESRRIEAKLKRSEEQYRKLFEDSNDAVLLHTRTGEIKDVNMRACQMTGYCREQLLSMTTKDLLSSDIENLSTDGNEKVLKEGFARFTRKFKKADGSIIDVEVSSSVIDPAKDIIQGVIRDITEIIKYRDQPKGSSYSRYTAIRCKDST